MGEKLKLLVADASDEDARLAIGELAREGYACEWTRAGTTAELRAALADPGWDLVLADVRLPGGGPSPLELYRQSGLDAPLIIVAGDVGEETAVELVRSGAHDVVPKNRVVRLPRVVRRELREAHARQARRRADALLRESEERYRKLFDQSNDAIFVIEKQTGRFLDANRSAEALTGRPLHELRKLTIADVSTGEYLERLRELPYSADGAQDLGEVDHVRPDGTLRTSLVGVVHIDDAVVYGIARDITEHRRADEALRRSERELRLLAAAIEQSEEGVIITDPAGVIEYVNPAFERITGYARHEAVGRHTRFLKSGRQDEAFYRDLWQTIVSGRTWEGRFVNRRKDGTLYTEDCTISPVFGAEGRIERFVAAKRDVTRSLHLEEELRQAQRVESVGRLAAGVAHDFNNLLSPILGYSELLLQDFHPSDERYSQIREIEQAARRARDLTRQLLAFGRKQTLQIKPVDLNAVVLGMERLMRRTLREDVELAVVPAGRPCVVLADTGQAEQVLMNLAVNAQDAMPGGGALTISVTDMHLDEATCEAHPGWRPGDYGVLTVTDTGVGMDEATRQLIFEPFFSTKGERGTGLGLATVYGIVTQHGGHVSVESEVGQGATFRVFFPSTVDAPPGESRSDGAGERPRGSETVLLVEDNEAVRHLAQAVLRREGYHVLSAAGGPEALDLLDRYDGPVHLLLTDVIMSGMDGRELFRRVAERRPGLKAIFMSGYTDDVIEHRGVLGDSVHFVQKPFSVSTLAQKLREVLGAQR